jgi:thiamine-monophosphate kinase
VSRGRPADSEHGWIRGMIRTLGRAGRAVVIGPGDDAAALRPSARPLLVTTDALVEGTHFRRSWIAPRALGARAYATNASDVAAMGGRPLAAVMALAVPRGVATATLDGIVSGFAAAARVHGASLVGGNVTRGRDLAVTVTLLGIAGPRIVTRGGARPGDHVFVTGTLGATATAIAGLRAGRPARLPPVPDRVRAGALLARVASAMIDVSDGLLADADHVGRASGAALWIARERIPVAAACRRRFGRRAATVAATAGEDYELLCTVPARRLAALARLLPRLGCALTPIGVVVRGPGGATLADATGRPIRVRARGFDHLR